MRPSHLALPLLALACTSAPEAARPAANDPAAGQPTAGSGPDAAASQGEASLSIERLDADADCDGLVPTSAPDPVAVKLDAPAGGACIGGVSDGTGAVALGVRDSGGAVTWRVRSAAGSPLGTFAADWPLLSEPAGWDALDVSRPPFGADPTVDHVAVSPSGAVVRRDRVTPDPTIGVGPRWSLAGDPGGGSAVAVRWTYVAGNHWSAVAVHQFDAAGTPRWTTDPPAVTVQAPGEPAFLGAGVPESGDVLLLTQHSAFLDVTWLDPGGSAAGGSVMQEPSQAVAGEGLSHVLELAPLLDASIAVRSDATWRRVYLPRAPASAPLPDWLAARAADAVRITRGGLGYALLPPSGSASPDCATRVELVSRGGRTCGRITIREPGTACTVRSVDQGWDGTLVAQSAAADACTMRWWPGLLAR